MLNGVRRLSCIVAGINSTQHTGSDIFLCSEQSHQITQPFAVQIIILDPNSLVKSEFPENRFSFEIQKQHFMTKS